MWFSFTNFRGLNEEREQTNCKVSLVAASVKRIKEANVLGNRNLQVNSKNYRRKQQHAYGFRKL